MKSIMSFEKYCRYVFANIFNIAIVKSKTFKNNDKKNRKNMIFFFKNI